MDWKEFFTSNWQAKLICLLLAFGLWFYIANDGFQTKSVDEGVMIETINLESTLAVVEELGSVDVKVRPSSGVVRDFSAEMFSAYVDLEGLGKGTYDLPIKVVAADSTIQIFDYEPSKVKVTIDDRVEKTFSVTSEVNGNPGDGYQVGEASLSHSNVLVGGAESVVGNISKVVAKANVDTALSEVKRSVELQAIDDQSDVIRNIYIEPKSVEIVIPVFQEADVKTVGVKVNSKNSPVAGYFIKSLEADPGTVVVRGERDVLQSIEYIETEPLDLSGLKESRDMQIDLVLPDDVEVEGDNLVTVKISIEGAESSKAVSGIFEFKNLSAGRNLGTFSPSNASLTLSGSKDRLDNLDSNDVRVLVNLAGKGSGTFTINLNSSDVVVPEGINVVSLDTNSIEVVVE